MVATRNSKKSATSSQRKKLTKVKAVIRGRDACDIIAKDNINLEDCIRVLRSKSKNIPSSPVKKKSRAWVRNPEPIRCTDFGRDRKEKYPDFFFCHQCDLYETITPDGLHRVNRESTRYKYRGNHKSRMFPTTRKKFTFHFFCSNPKYKKVKK